MEIDLKDNAVWDLALSVLMTSEVETCIPGGPSYLPSSPFGINP